MALLILGNLGTVRMIWQGWQLTVVSEEQMRAGSIPDQLTWALPGYRQAISGGDVHQYYTGDWYWKPSRAIQPEAGNEITEFPFFTFLYADLHAHLMALPVTLLVLGWALAMVLGKGRWGLRGRTAEVGLVGPAAAVGRAGGRRAAPGQHLGPVYLPGPGGAGAGVRAVARPEAGANGPSDAWGRSALVSES